MSDMAETPGAAANRRYPGIEILRGIAASLVLVYHVIEIGKWSSFPIEGPLLAFRIGWIGVDLFFVISGFVIASSVMSGLGKGHGLAEFRLRFAERRWRRIAPLYFLTILATLFLVQPDLLVQGVRTIAFHVGTHVLFIHNLWFSTHGSINGPNWSVALEMQFYLMMMLLGPWLVGKRPLLVAVALVVVAVAYRAVAFHLGGGATAEAWKMHIYVSQLPGCLDEFGVGIALAIAARQGLGRWLLPRFPHFLAWTLVAFLVMTVAMKVFWPRADYWPHWQMVVGWRSLLALGFGGVVLAALCVPASLATVLWPLRYLGEISYGIYLWHLPVLLTLVGFGIEGGMRLLAMTAAGTILLAAFSWHFVEQHYMQGRWRRRDAVAVKGQPESA